MKHAIAKEILERYFAGETSLTEEKLLREYFRAGDIHPDIAEYRDLFTYWDLAGQVKAPAAKARRRRLPLRWLSAAAAASALLFAATQWLEPAPELSDFQMAEAKTVDWSKYEVTDEKEAYLILRSALKTASTSMNQSTKGVMNEVSEAAAMIR